MQLCNGMQLRGTHLSAKPAHEKLHPPALTSRDYPVQTGMTTFSLHPKRSSPDTGHAQKTALSAGLSNGSGGSEWSSLPPYEQGSGSRDFTGKSHDSAGKSRDESLKLCQSDRTPHGNGLSGPEIQWVDVVPEFGGGVGTTKSGDLVSESRDCAERNGKSPPRRRPMLEYELGLLSDDDDDDSSLADFEWDDSFLDELMASVTVTTTTAAAAATARGTLDSPSPPPDRTASSSSGSTLKASSSVYEDTPIQTPMLPLSGLDGEEDSMPALSSVVGSFPKSLMCSRDSQVEQELDDLSSSIPSYSDVPPLSGTSTPASSPPPLSGGTTPSPPFPSEEDPLTPYDSETPLPPLESPRLKTPHGAVRKEWKGHGGAEGDLIPVTGSKVKGIKGPNISFGGWGSKFTWGSVEPRLSGHLCPLHLSRQSG